MSASAFLAKHFPFFSAEAKTLDQAKTNNTAAKAKVEAVAQLFENAGLDVDAMLSTGPDALKAHILSVGATDTQLADLNAKLTTANAELTTKTALVATHAATIAAHVGEIATLKSQQSTAVAVATEMLAKAGHTVVKETPDKNAAAASNAAVKTRAEVNAMTPGAKQKFYREGGTLSEL